jgi:hypothetical protein
VHLRGVSMQFFRSYFDCQASGSFWWPAGESDGRRHVKGKNDLCNVSKGTSSPLKMLCLFWFHRAGLIGVLGATASCESGVRPVAVPHGLSIVFPQTRCSVRSESERTHSTFSRPSLRNAYWFPQLGAFRVLRLGFASSFL